MMMMLIMMVMIMRRIPENDRRCRKDRRRKDEGEEGVRKERRRKDAGFEGERKEGLLGRKNCRSRMLGGGDMVVEQFPFNHLNHLSSCLIVLGFRIVCAPTSGILSRFRIVQFHVCCMMTMNETGFEEQQSDAFVTTMNETGFEEQQFDSCRD